MGQGLHVTGAEGWLQRRAGDGGALTLGDSAHAPAGEEHGHGALPESYMSPRAVSVGARDRLTAVSEAEYADATRGR